MRSILQIMRILAARYPHRFFYSSVGFILAVMLMAFGFWRMLAIIAITFVFYFFGLLSDHKITFKEFIKGLFKK